MNLLRRLFLSLFPTTHHEPDWAAIADRSLWSTSTTRGRWATGPERK